jgi:hypothetical protein
MFAMIAVTEWYARACVCMCVCVIMKSFLSWKSVVIIESLIGNASIEVLLTFGDRAK